MNTYHRIIFGVLVLALITASFGLGVYAGYMERPEAEKITELFHITNADITDTADFEPFWKAWNLIKEHYGGEIPNPQERVWGAISGMVASVGDPYTVFFPPQESEKFEEDISGQFQGVGMEIGIRDDVLTVIAPLKDTPAERAGMRSGDRILTIDEESTDTVSVDDAVSLIRGPQGSDVVLTVLHEDAGETEDITITRAVIDIPTIDTDILDGTTGIIKQSAGPKDVFVISLYNFSAQSPNLFRNALQEFIKSNTHKLILDLRGNPGGYLEASVDMASWFLPSGKTIVRESYDDKEDEQVHRSKGYDIFTDYLDMVVLIDGGSASASEILAGALSEHDIATLVGKTTFGKGSVQELISVTDETSLKITVAKWLTPEGNSISDGGITPDIEVEMTYDDFTAGDDPQMDAAIDFLQGND
ncbi:MAG: S41 family peptidase [Parcubacteria group bacterium]|nr:S41 family peptidase [Parcubacteria group bacterium]